MRDADLEVALLEHAESVPFSTAVSDTVSAAEASLAQVSSRFSSSEIGSKWFSITSLLLTTGLLSVVAFLGAAASTTSVAFAGSDASAAAFVSTTSAAAVAGTASLWASDPSLVASFSTLSGCSWSEAFIVDSSFLFLALDLPEMETKKN